MIIEQLAAHRTNCSRRKKRQSHTRIGYANFTYLSVSEFLLLLLFCCLTRRRNIEQQPLWKKKKTGKSDRQLPVDTTYIKITIFSVAFSFAWAQKKNHFAVERRPMMMVMMMFILCLFICSYRELLSCKRKYVFVDCSFFFGHKNPCDETDDSQL